MRMGRESKNSRRRSGTVRARGGLRAIRCADRDADLKARLAVIDVDPQTTHGEPRSNPRIERALRAERRAARSGVGYDPMRHLVLVRLARKR
jgi:hypothetical protein